MKEEKTTKETQGKPSAPNGTEKPKHAEEKSLRAYFVRLFGKYDFRNEGQFISFCKWLLYILLLLVEGLVIWQQLTTAIDSGKWGMFVALLIVVAVLTLSEALMLFAVPRSRGKIVFYIFDALAACCFLLFTSDFYAVVVYALVLTEFYISAEKNKLSVLVFCLSLPVYAVCYALRMRFVFLPEAELLERLRDSLGAVIALVVHFLAIHIALAFYRQFLRLDRALRELDQSKKELEKAYEVVAEVTALEERQRIAKDIHDTAGHSLTTVIMQTEAAKRIIDRDPDEAKNKLVAANLQARHALEELRDSVHLLSGVQQQKTLKAALEGIVHESTDGTGIKIRSEIGEAQVSEAKHRFLCNTLKEGISNALRHGGATAFWFEFKNENGKLQFLLSDNGKGLSIADLQPGFGLSTMQARAHSLGGEVTFESEPDEGFEIRLTLPADMEE